MPSLPPSEINELVLNNIQSVHAAANRLNVPRGAVRDELVSAGYEALLMAAGRYDPTAKATFRTFAFRPVLGAMFDTLGTQARYARRHSPLSTEADADTPSASSAPDFERTTLTAQVLGALEELPPLPRYLIKSHFLDEETLSTVASRHGMSKTRASVEIARAIQELRQKLDDRFAEWPTVTKVTKRRFSDPVREQVIRRASQPDANICALARELNIPRATIHTWLKPLRRRARLTQLAA